MKDKKITRREFISISAMAATAAALSCTSISYITKKLEELKNRDKYPAVIIGAGLGGLTCAAFLARSGFPVTVVEQHDIPGGYATSFKRDNFDFDVSLHATAVHNNSTYEMYRNLGLLEKIEVVELVDAHRVVIPGNDFIIPDSDPVAYIDLLSSIFPDERKGIMGFIDEIVRIHTETDELGRTISTKGYFDRTSFPEKYPKMWEVRNQTLKQMIDKHVKDNNVKGILGYLWGYYGLPPSKLSGFYYATATGDYLKNGSYYIKPRSQNLSNALAEIIKEHGGKVILGTPVDKIIAKDGTVSGVRTADGKVLPARIVVSNANVPDTFTRLLSTDIDYKKYLKKLSRYRPSVSTFNVWLGLKGELRGKIPGCDIFVSSGNNTEIDYQHSLKGNFDKAGFGVTVYNNYFEGYANPGTSIVSLLYISGYKPWQRFERDYFAGRKKEYNRVKERIAGNLIQRTEKHVIPGLSSMIEVMDSSTPLTNIRYTRNPQGSIYGYEQSMDNSFMNRIQNKTPVKGLYLAGAWGNPGGGYGAVMGSGERTFSNIVEDILKKQ